MAHLKLNNFEVKAQINSGSADDDGPAFQQRMYDGTVMRDEIADQQIWGFTSDLLTKAERDQLRHLIRGDGERWSFDADIFGSKGDGATGTFVISGTDPKFGGKRIEPTPDARFTPGFYDGVNWTVAYWRDETTGAGASWRHVIVNSAGQKWNNGVLDAGLAITELTTAAGFVQLDDVFEAFDDLVILPWSITTEFGNAWPQAFAYSDLPRLRAEGDEFEKPPVTVMGEWNGSVIIAGVTNFYRGQFALWES